MPDESIFLNGQLEAKSHLKGNLSKPFESLSGSLSNPNTLSGSLSEDLSELKGSLNDDLKLVGVLSEPLQILSGILANPDTLTGKLSNATLRGYSAYDLAVLAGFEGTEEEWLASLHGKDGTSIDIRNNNGILEYKHSTDSSWTVLINLNSYYNDYERLNNKPRLDGTVLLGNRDLSDKYVLMDRALTNLEIEELLI